MQDTIKYLDIHTTVIKPFNFGVISRVGLAGQFGLFFFLQESLTEYSLQQVKKKKKETKKLTKRLGASYDRNLDTPINAFIGKYKKQLYIYIILYYCGSFQKWFSRTHDNFSKQQPRLYTSSRTMKSRRLPRPPE